MSTWLVETREVGLDVCWLFGWVVTRMHCGKLAERIGMPLDYDEQWAGTTNSEIFESAHHFEIELERPIQTQIESRNFAGPYLTVIKNYIQVINI